MGRTWSLERVLTEVCPLFTNTRVEIGVVFLDIENLSRLNADSSDHSLATLECSGLSALLTSDAEHIPYFILRGLL